MNSRLRITPVAYNDEFRVTYYGYDYRSVADSAFVQKGSEDFTILVMHGVVFKINDLATANKLLKAYGTTYGTSAATATVAPPGTLPRPSAAIVGKM